MVLATGAAAEPAFGAAHVFNWDDTCGADAIGGLLRDLEEGYSQRLAIVIPPGPGWPLPAYELALLVSSDARGMGMKPEITLVTPEQAPLAIFGPRAVELVTEELKHAGVQVELGAYAEFEPGPPSAIVLRPSGRRLKGGRVLALPRLRGRAPEGVPADADGFVTVDAHGRVAGAEHVWAAGDGIAFRSSRRPRRRTGRRRHRGRGRRAGRARPVPSRAARAPAHGARPALPAPRRFGRRR